MTYIEKYCKMHNMTVNEFWKKAKNERGFVDMLHTYGCPPNYHSNCDDCMTWWERGRDCEDCWMQTIIEK